MTHRFPLLAALALFLALNSAATAQNGRTVNYAILKEGEPIGRETYLLLQEGEHVTVKLTVESRVRILLIDFRYSHKRSESWNGDRLERLVADTDDDGSKHHVEAVADGNGGLTVTSDARPAGIATSAFPLSMWRRSIVGHDNLFAVESGDGPLHVAFKDLGPEVVTIGGRAVDCQHYMMTGDVDRDLWYDADGLLAKASFRRRGFGITILREPSS